MNIILFSPEELDRPLPLEDRRAWHILNILKCRTGDSFCAGIINGLMGSAVLKSIEEKFLCLEWSLQETPAPLYPVFLVVGLCRPQTVKKILQEATSLGVAGIFFTRTVTGEKSYGTSTLWTNAEYEKYILLGAEQAYTTRLPVVKRYYTLKRCLEALESGARIAFDNYTDSVPVRELTINQDVCYIAIGPERGWSGEELIMLNEAGFLFSNLGKRVLRVETACVASIILILEKMRLI